MGIFDKLFNNKNTNELSYLISNSELKIITKHILEIIKNQNKIENIEQYILVLDNLRPINYLNLIKLFKLINENLNMISISLNNFYEIQKNINNLKDKLNLNESKDLSPEFYKLNGNDYLYQKSIFEANFKKIILPNKILIIDLYSLISKIKIKSKDYFKINVNFLTILKNDNLLEKFIIENIKLNDNDNNKIKNILLKNPISHYENLFIFTKFESFDQIYIILNQLYNKLNSINNIEDITKIEEIIEYINLIKVKFNENSQKIDMFIKNIK